MLLPLPETPVTATKTSNGKFIFIFFRLFPVAPFKLRNFEFPTLLFAGILIFLFHVKYCAVNDFFDLCRSLGLPENVILPPNFPAPGPISST